MWELDGNCFIPTWLGITLLIGPALGIFIGTILTTVAAERDKEPNEMHFREKL